MNMPPQAERKTDRWLRDAIAERAPLTLHIRTRQGWVTGKSRFLGDSGRNRTITLSWPSELREQKVRLQLGQLLGVAFRHGLYKCVFEAEVVTLPEEPTRNRPTIVLRWPDDIQQLQRRLYYRSRVPDHLTIPVHVARLAPAGDAGDCVLSSRGVLLDLSAGGMGIVLPANPRQQWNRGDTMTCLVPLEPAHEPRELTGRLRHVERTTQGHLRLGLEFVGLETTATGLETTRCITRTVGRFRQLAPRRGWRPL